MKVGSKVKFKLGGKELTGKYVRNDSINEARFVVDVDGRLYTVDDPKNAKPVHVKPRPCKEGAGPAPLKSGDPEQSEAPKTDEEVTE